MIKTGSSNIQEVMGSTEFTHSNRVFMGSISNKINKS